MNRRTFLQSGLAGAALTLPPFARGVEPRPRGTSSPIPLGFFGISHSHGLEKLRLALASPDWQVVGVSEDEPAAREAATKLGARLLPPAELIERSRVIAVESAVRDHARHALQALQAGRHVHVEKPASVTLAEMKSLLAVARAKKLLLQTGYMWRYHPGFRVIFDAVRQGWLGEVFMVRGHISNHLASARRGEWGEFAGGVFYELGSHLLDAVVRLLGQPKAVTPSLRRHGDFRDEFMDNTAAVLEFDRALAILTATSLQPTGKPERSFEVLGTRGAAVLRPIEPPTLQLELSQPAGPYSKGLQTVPLPAYRRYEADFVELAAAVRGERPLSVTLDEEWLVQETLLRASGMEPRP